MSCDAFRELLADYLEDKLDDVRRTGFRSHLRDCPECRSFAVAEDPTLMLSLADRRQPPADRIEACVTGVMAGIRQERLQQKLRPASRRPWLAAAAAVVCAVLVGAVWWISYGRPTDSPMLQADAQPVKAAESVEVDAPVESAQSRAATEPPPRVEVEMSQEEVRVYQYTIGDDQSTGAVFIVNPGMEL
jgi:anti-sigma factor RsiW